MSCTETSEDIFFALHNDTDKAIELRAFESKGGKLLDVINILPFSQHQQKQTIGFSDTQSRAFYSEFGVDSVRVIFDMSKVTVYTGYNNQSINLEIIYGDNREYRITNEDFSKGMECNNNCR